MTRVKSCDVAFVEKAHLKNGFARYKRVDKNEVTNSVVNLVESTLVNVSTQLAALSRTLTQFNLSQQSKYNEKLAKQNDYFSETVS